ncbi:MAG: MBL fold metallo-hydrolase, partial [Anaeroplasmataceae bacterium]|nr:MBL fold metallo-hydrolase [Anaeroplasmataceae bacterium]
PGHTRGSVVYSYKDKLLSGDTLFHMSMGRTDFPTGNAKSMRDSLKKIIEEFPDFIDVYPGHDEKTTIGYERKNNPYL